MDGFGKMQKDNLLSLMTTKELSSSTSSQVQVKGRPCCILGICYSVGQDKGGQTSYWQGSVYPRLSPHLKQQPMGLLSIRNTPALLFPVALTRGDTLSDSEPEPRGNSKPGIRTRLSLGMTQMEKLFESQHLNLSHLPVFSFSNKGTLSTEV